MKSKGVRSLSGVEGLSKRQKVLINLFFAESLVMPVRNVPYVCLVSGLILSSPVVVADLRADSHAPTGVMFEHLHQQGAVMVAYHVEQTQQQGDLLRGGRTLKASDSSANSYAMLPTDHTMTMQMLDIMYAPSNNLTLMLMPMVMTMEMGMAKNDFYIPAVGAHTGHSHGGGHRVSGMGDTTLAALYRLHRDNQQELIATLAVIAPTGQENVRGIDGKPVHYGMQLGAGMWQAMPSLTYRYKHKAFVVGAQALTCQPLENRNELNVRVPDLNQATVWLSYAWLDELSTSLRVQYRKKDVYEGHYNVTHNHSAPADKQGNYGGEQTLIGAGVNWVMPTGAFKGLRLGAEYLAPVAESVNGVQLTTKRQWQMSASKAY